MAEKPLICLIGCGLTGQFLLDYLLEDWRLIVIEKDHKQIKHLTTKYQNEDVVFIEGDASSALILEEAQVANAYQVIVSINNDAMVKEVAALLVDRFEVNHISAKVNERKTANHLRKKNVNVIVPSENIANLIINQLEFGESFALHVGKGEGEIMQIQLTSNSPLIDIPLRDLPPRPWIIGAIYRPKSRFKMMKNLPYLQRLNISKEDEFILPSGDTVARPGDKLVLIGDPKVLKSTAYYLKAGETVFPTRYGDTVISLFLVSEKDRGAHKEYKWLLHRMQPTTTYFVYNRFETKQIVEKLSFPKSWVEAGKDTKELFEVKTMGIPKFITKLSLSKRIGLVIYKQPLELFRRVIHHFFLLPKLLKTLRRNSTPIWLIRHHDRISKITLFVTPDEGTMRAAELAMDASLKLALPIRAIQVLAPKIVAGSDALDKDKEVLAHVRDLASLYGTSLEETIVEGNPVVETLKLVKKDELLVLALPYKNNRGLFIPNVAKKLEKKFNGSLLILPF